jgi:hypothetical protein
MAAAIGVAIESGDEEELQALKRTLLGKQLRKTSMCAFFSLGKCKYGAACDFAHTESELQTVPDFRKTRMCEAFAAGRCNDKDCKFAHGRGELRQRDARSRASVCIWFARGSCTRGAGCTFLHDVPEPHPEVAEQAVPNKIADGGLAKRLDLPSLLRDSGDRAAGQAGQRQRARLNPQAAMFTPGWQRPVKVNPSSTLNSSSLNAPSDQTIVDTVASLSSQLQALQSRMEGLYAGRCADDAKVLDSSYECSTSAASSDAGTEPLSATVSWDCPMRVE